MVMERYSTMDEARLARARSIGEIKDALRELRASAPDSVLARLAEQMIERMEKGHHEDRDHHRGDPDRGADRNG